MAAKVRTRKVSNRGEPGTSYVGHGSIPTPSRASSPWQDKVKELSPKESLRLRLLPSFVAVVGLGSAACGKFGVCTTVSSKGVWEL